MSESLFKEAQDRAEVMYAFGGGKTIESKSKESNNWQEDHFPSWNWEEYDYRVKAKKKWRAFRNADEFPKGIIKIKSKKSTSGWALIVGVGSYYLVGSAGDKLVKETFTECFNNGDEISLDGGKTWQPCGVEES